MKRHVGIAGVGLMGHGIATNIVKHGHHLTVLEHAGNQPLDTLKQAGAKSVAKPRDLAAATDVIILVLTGSPQVESVITGPDGLLAGLRQGSVVIDCSTALPASTQAMAKAVVAAGGQFLDAPMTRTPKEAAEGRLNLLVGGPADVLQAHLPLLRCFAENITHTGGIGSGHSMKLLHNYVSLGMVTLLAEAAACADARGVSREVFTQVLAQGGGGGVALERLKPYLLANDPTGLRFSIANAAKDLGYYEAMAAQAGAYDGIATAVASTLQKAAAISEVNTPVPELVATLPRLRSAAP